MEDKRQPWHPDNYNLPLPTYHLHFEVANYLEEFVTLQGTNIVFNSSAHGDRATSIALLHPSLRTFDTIRMSPIDTRFDVPTTTTSILQTAISLALNSFKYYVAESVASLTHQYFTVLSHTIHAVPSFSTHQFTVPVLVH